MSLLIPKLQLGNADVPEAPASKSFLRSWSFTILTAINNLRLLYLCHARMFLSGIHVFNTGFPIKTSGMTGKMSSYLLPSL